MAERAARVRPADAGAENVDDRPRSRKGLRTRARLIDAAKVIFERDGFLEARIADITETAGLAPGSFYHYFESKEQIFREVAAAQEERLTAPADDESPTADDSAWERIRRANRRYLERYRDEAALMGVIEQVSRYDEHVNAARMATMKHFVERAEVAIRGCRPTGRSAAGSIRPSPPMPSAPWSPGSPSCGSSRATATTTSTRRSSSSRCSGATPWAWPRRPELAETGEVADLRVAVRSWLDEHAPAKGSPGDFSASHLASPTSVADFQAHEHAVFDRASRWQRQLYDAGWSGLSWPVDYGGQGREPWCDDVVAEEQSRYGVSTKILSIGLQMASSVLFRHGTEDQRVAHLPAIVRGDEVWCQLFSEPDAGSDLPNIGTRAIPSPEGWVVTGQKVWTSGATVSDFGMALARTDPGSSGRRGVSCFIVDMHAPGVEVRPLRQMSGGYHFNEVFLTDVQVGHGELVGDLGDGWAVARTMLSSERASIGSGTSARSAVQLRSLAAELDRDHDPVVRQAMARAHSRETVLDLLLARLHDGARVPAAGSVVKLLYSEHARLSANDALELLGGHGLVVEDRSAAWLDRFLFAPGLRIGGGTDEIQRNQIAEQGLGLPREPRS